MIYRFNSKKKKNNLVVTAATLFTVAAIVFATTTMAPLTALGSRLGGGEEEGFIEPILQRKAAPVVVSGDNIYIAWGTNNTENGNEEVMFRASNDGGATFGDMINISTSVGDSADPEIAAEDANVIVTWWETTNQTSGITPVARISNDGGETFGPDLRLAANGTIASTEEGEGAAAAEGTEEGEEG
jgi:hypothetical protein